MINIYPDIILEVAIIYRQNSLRAMAKKAAEEKAEYEAKKAFKANLKRSGFTPTF